MHIRDKLHRLHSTVCPSNLPLNSTAYFLKYPQDASSQGTEGRGLPTLLALEALDKAAGPLLGSHVKGDARELAVDVERALQLQEVPVLHDHLRLGARDPMLTGVGCEHTSLSTSPSGTGVSRDAQEPGMH